MNRTLKGKDNPYGERTMRTGVTETNSMTAEALAREALGENAEDFIEANGVEFWLSD